MPETPQLPDLSNHPSAVIRKLAPHVLNLYNMVEFVGDDEQVESLRALMRKAATDVISNDDFGSFDAIIHAVSSALHNSLKK